MPGKKGSTRSRRNKVAYLYDEGLPPRIGEVLAHVGYPITIREKGAQDEELIPWMGENNYTWITKDDRSKVKHEDLIVGASISIIYLRGLTVERARKSSPKRNTIQMKDVLKMLVDKLDGLTEILETTRSPRYFLLYMTAGRKTHFDRFASLRELKEHLSGTRNR